MSSSTRATRDGVASHRVAEQLRADILRGVYPPGTRLLQENIAEQFSASRIPVREALRVLQADGLVTLVANTGAWISQLSLAECEELYQIREGIEPLLLRYSLPNMSAEVLDRLTVLADEMPAAPDVEAFLRLDREFHMLSYSGADTLMLGATIERLWNATQHYRRAFTSHLDAHGRSMVHHEHVLLAGALRGGSSDDAERVLLGHIRRTRLELERHPEVFH